MNDAADRNVESARNDLYRAALRYWAREGKYDETEIIEWFDNLFNTYPSLDHIPYNEPVWESFFVRWPINLPRNAEGKVDTAALDQMTSLQRATPRQHPPSQTGRRSCHICRRVRILGLVDR